MRRCGCQGGWLFVPATFSDSKRVMMVVYITKYTARTKHKAKTARIKPPNNGGWIITSTPLEMAVSTGVGASGTYPDSTAKRTTVLAHRVMLDPFIYLLRSREEVVFLFIQGMRKMC